MDERSGIYLPGDKSPREWITCKGCQKRALVRVGGKGFCSKECANRHRSGTRHPRWRGNQAGYFAMHVRVYAARGKADRCSQCGRTDPALDYQWANLTGHYEDVDDYAPMCVPCHAAYDAPGKPRGSDNANAKLTEEQVSEARRRFASGESARSMAPEYGVTGVALLNAIKGKTWNHVPMEGDAR